MFLIPKKESGFDEEVGVFHEPEHTRPISVVGFDNRILANAARLRMEMVFQRWVSQAQRGFVGGRSLLANVVDIDTAMRTFALDNPAAACILFDFSAAFPSVDQGFTVDMLAWIGVPSHLLNVVKGLYHSNACEVVLSGQRFSGFSISAGCGRVVLFAIALCDCSRSTAAPHSPPSPIGATKSIC